MPAFSVVLPVYNRAGTIARAVRSVLDQSFGDFELIVVDDGSTDTSRDVVAGISDPRLRLLVQDRNRGGCAARNRGIAAAAAPLLAFLDSDDAYLPDKLAYEAEYFAAYPKVDLLLSGFITDYERDKADVVEANPVIEDNRALLEALFQRRIRKATPGITVRRTVAEAIGGFDEELKRRQDFDFIVRAARVGRVATTDQALWIKTYPADAISADDDSFVAGALAFYRRHPDYYGDPAYRRGFALDVARHFRRRIKARAVRTGLRELAMIGGAVGWLRTTRLLAQGPAELKRHRRARRRRRKAL